MTEVIAMSDMDLDPDALGMDDIEADLDTALAAEPDEADTPASVPDPAESGDVATPHFAGTDVEFPDGTTVTNPYEDDLGNVYKDRESYLGGVDPHEKEDPPDESGTSQAHPTT